MKSGCGWWTRPSSSLGSQSTKLISLQAAPLGDPSIASPEHVQEKSTVIFSVATLLLTAFVGSALLISRKQSRRSWVCAVDFPDSGLHLPSCSRAFSLPPA
jgi:hypothetical protein